MQNRFALGCRQVPLSVVIVALAFAPHPSAGAGIVASTGEVRVLSGPPGSVGPRTEATRVFVERSLALGGDLTVDATATGAYPPNGSPGAVIPAGAEVTSYFLVFDALASSTRRVSTGTLVFDRDILGVIIGDARLNATDAALGASGTAYPTTTSRGVETSTSLQSPPVDTFTISSDRRTFTFSFQATALDHMRVIVAGAGDAVASASGEVVVLPAPPASVASGGVEPSRVFLERSMTLATGLNVDSGATGDYPPNGSPGALIPPGAVIASYLLELDAYGSATAITRRTSTGTLAFDRDVLGVIFTESGLDATDATLGAAGTTYATTALRGVETTTSLQGVPVDSFAISADRKTLSFHFEASLLDQMRVIVSALGEVSAGADQTVCEGDLVSLASSITPDEETLTVGWNQIGGTTTQVLSGAGTRIATFVAQTASPTGETCTFELTVSDGQSFAMDRAEVTIKHRNLPPVADAGADRMVLEGAPVQLDAAFGSFDPEGDALGYTWTQIAGPSVLLSDPGSAAPAFTAPAVGSAGALLVFRVTVTDLPGNANCGSALADSDEVAIQVTSVNQPPTAEAGQDQTVAEGALVQLDCSGSSDLDADPLGFEWTQTAGSPVSLSDPFSATPTFLAPAQGAHAHETLAFQCQVSDGALRREDVVQVTVQDVNAPPDCSLARAEPSLLWPPDHRFSSIAIAGVSDPGDPVAITVVAVSQDEPTNGLGDADTAPDAILPIRGVPTASDPLLLRRERSGEGDGRVYQVSFVAHDGFGGTCQGTVLIGVPHGRRSSPVDGGALHDSTQP